MRTITTLSTFLLTALLLSFRSTTNPLTITGHLKKNPKNTSVHINGLTIFVKADNKIVDKTITDDKGNFILSFTPRTEKSFNFYCTGVGIDTLVLYSTDHFESDEIELSLLIPGNTK